MSRAGLLLAFALSMTVVGEGRAGGMTMGHPYPAGSSFDIWARDLAQCIEKEVGLYIEVIGDGQLGRSQDLAKSVVAGVVDAALLPATAFDGIWPELNELATPGYVTDTETARHLAGQPDLARNLEDSGGWERNLAILGVGWRYSLLVGHATDPTDLIGRKVRVSQDAQGRFIEAMGAVPTPIQLAEVFSALEVGVIDASIMDAEMALSMAEQDGFEPIGWSDQMTPFISAHVAVMSQASAEIFGLKGGREIASACAWTALAFTDRSIETARAAAARAPDAGSSALTRWRDALENFSRDAALDPGIRAAIDESRR